MEVVKDIHGTVARVILTCCLCALTASCAIYDEKVCFGTHRGFVEPASLEANLLDMRERYTGCTFVQGNLEVTWLRSEDLDLSFLSTIREVSGYVLLFNVGVLKVPLTSLQVIRGEKLIKTTAQREGFALLANTVTSRYLEMPALREIQIGCVAFVHCYNLCHIKDILWKNINQAWASNTFDITESEEECLPCHAACNGRCWGQGPQNCQRIRNLECDSECSGRCFSRGQSGCCHSYCSIGCRGPQPDDCIACKHYDNDGTCVISCPRGKYRYGATCVRNCPDPMLKDGDACVSVCPPGKRAMQGECIACEGHCHKVCEGVGVIHSGNIANFRNCTKIQGSLEIKDISFSGFQEFHFNFVPGPHYQEMHPNALEVLNTVKEITGYLSVRGSHPFFKDLSFFRSLEIIQGDNLTENHAALLIERTSIKTLGLRSLKTISNGGISIQQNWDLCLLKHRDWNKVKKSPYYSIQIQGNRQKNKCDVDGFTCHHQCSSEGCWGTKADECFSCVNYKLKDTCIALCRNSSELAVDVSNDDEICFTRVFLPGISLYLINENTRELVSGYAWDDSVVHAYVTTHKQYQIWMKHLSGSQTSSEHNHVYDLDNCPNRQTKWVTASNGTFPKGAFLGGTHSWCMLYIGRTQHDGDIIPGKICDRYHAIFIVSGGKQHSINNYQALIGSNYEWVLSSGKNIPKCAVRGGKLKDGTPLYIGRTQNGAALDVGLVNPTDGILRIPFFWKVYPFPSYEILVFKSQRTLNREANEPQVNRCSQMTAQWKYVTTENTITDGVASTNDPECMRYVGRATYDRDLTPGKYLPSSRTFFITFGEEQIQFEEFQLLVGNNYEWIPGSKEKIPDCAVKGGETADGTPLYIGKAKQGDCFEIGKVNPVNGLLYLGYFQKEYTFTEYDILVYKT